MLIVWRKRCSHVFSWISLPWSLIVEFSVVTVGGNGEWTFPTFFFKPIWHEYWLWIIITYCFTIQPGYNVPLDLWIPVGSAPYSPSCSGSASGGQFFYAKQPSNFFSKSPVRWHFINCLYFSLGKVKSMETLVRHLCTRRLCWEMSGDFCNCKWILFPTTLNAIFFHYQLIVCDVVNVYILYICEGQTNKTSFECNYLIYSELKLKNVNTYTIATKRVSYGRKGRFLFKFLFWFASLANKVFCPFYRSSNHRQFSKILPERSSNGRFSKTALLEKVRRNRRKKWSVTFRALRNEVITNNNWKSYAHGKLK